MNPSDPTRPPAQPQPTIHNPLAVMQPGEHIVCEIRRHPIGIFLMYGACGLVLVLLALGCFVALPGLLGEGSTAATAIAGGIFVIFTVLTLMFALVSTIVYWGNTWVVTSDSLTQMSHTSIFHKQSAQLSLNDLEDITIEKHGILTHLFNYGVLKAETAGERSKFLFQYCPNPNYYAHKILAAREQLERSEAGAPAAHHPPQPQSVSPAPAFPPAPSAPPYQQHQPPAGPGQQAVFAPPPLEMPQAFPPVDQSVNPPDHQPPPSPHA